MAGEIRQCKQQVRQIHIGVMSLCGCFAEMSATLLDNASEVQGAEEVESHISTFNFHLVQIIDSIDCVLKELEVMSARAEAASTRPMFP